MTIILVWQKGQAKGCKLFLEWNSNISFETQEQVVQSKGALIHSKYISLLSEPIYKHQNLCDERILKFCDIHCLVALNVIRAHRARFRQLSTRDDRVDSCHSYPALTVGTASVKCRGIIHFLPRRIVSSPRHRAGRTMDDELEGEVVQEIFWAHVSLVSRAARTELLPMADAAAFYVRLYVLRPGTLAVFVALLAAVLLCQSTNDAWLRLLLRRFELLGRPDAVKQLLRRSQPVGSSTERRSWEMQAKHAGVFAMQGRRPRMEDRFCILSNEQHDLHLYGVFDGHGGEVASDFAEQRLFPSLMPKLVEAVQRQQAAGSGETVEQLLSEFSQLLTDEILQLDTDLLVILKNRHDLSGSVAWKHHRVFMPHTLFVELQWPCPMHTPAVQDERGSSRQWDARKGERLCISIDRRRPRMCRGGAC
ncbi:uncharacterized protein LOC142573148 isoform X2 [Dermacentor variabilis]|uniref:uncharacterized protein LOC142573148 isoform X2 n=1 Tax=Dermacentor variabilis TaxID=34621 RepID=UPI003F5C9594